MNYTNLLLLLFILLTSFTYAQSDLKYILKVDAMSTYPTQIYPESMVSINVIVENISLISDAENVEVSLNLDDKYFDIEKNSEKLNVIKFNQAGTFALKFKVKEFVEGGYYSIPLIITYENKGQKYTINNQVRIMIENYDLLNVVLEEYPRSELYLSENQTIKGYVKNEGNKTLKGVFVKFKYDDVKLVPKDDISKFLGDINPKDKKYFEFEFTIPKNAQTGIYDVEVIATDIFSNEDIQKISLVIEDDPRLIISSVEKSIDTSQGTILKPNDNFSLSVQLENISKSKAKLVNIDIIEFNSNFEGTNKSYLGSIDSEDSSSAIFDLKVNKNTKSGNHNITLKITYLDEYDVEREFIEEVSLYVGPKDPSYTLLYLIIVLFLGYFGYKYYKNRKMKENKLKSIK